MSTTPEIPFRRGVISPVECLTEGFNLIKDQYWLFLGICAVAMIVPTERRDRGLSGSSRAGGCRDQGYTVATTPFRAPDGTSKP